MEGGAATAAAQCIRAACHHVSRFLKTGGAALQRLAFSNSTVMEQQRRRDAYVWWSHGAEQVHAVVDVAAVVAPAVQGPVLVAQNVASLGGSRTDACRCMAAAAAGVSSCWAASALMQCERWCICMDSHPYQPHAAGTALRACECWWGLVGLGGWWERVCRLLCTPSLLCRGERVLSSRERGRARSPVHLGRLGTCMYQLVHAIAASVQP